MKYGIGALAALICASAIWTQEEEKGKPEHCILTPDDVKWTDGPPSLPPGAKMALLEGDPKKDGYFSLRLKFPAGYKIPPHWHPKDERVTVISGKAKLGLGESYDENAMRDLPPGSYFSLPAKTAHYAFAAEETVIQLNTIGPWDLTYLREEDDPRKKP